MFMMNRPDIKPRPQNQPQTQPGQPFYPQQQMQPNVSAIHQYYEALRNKQGEYLHHIVDDAFARRAQQVAADLAGKNNELGRELTGTVVASLNSVSTKLESIQDHLSGKLRNMQDEIQSVKEEQQHVRQDFTEGVRQLQMNQGSLTEEHSALSAQIANYEKRTQEQFHSILSCIKNTVTKVEQMNTTPPEMPRDLLCDILAQQERILQLFVPKEYETKRTTRSQSKKFGNGLQNMPSVMTAAEALVKAMKDELSAASRSPGADKGCEAAKTENSTRGPKRRRRR